VWISPWEDEVKKAYPSPRGELPWEGEPGLGSSSLPESYPQGGTGHRHWGGKVFSRGVVVYSGDRQGADLEVMIAPWIHPGIFWTKIWGLFLVKNDRAGGNPFHGS